MKRVVCLYSLALISLAAGLGTWVHTPAKSPESKTDCPFNITGLWRSDTATDMTRIIFSFSPEGHITLLGHSPDTLAQDFEVITSVGYKLDVPGAPKRIEFTAWRGDDVFPKGVSTWKIVEFGENSFTTVNPDSEQQTRWVRERTHRYFLTLAAGSGTGQQGGPAFAMWTTLGGREPSFEALGVRLATDQSGRTVPVFGLIPAEVYDNITEAIQKDKKTKEEIVIVRLELTRAEFDRTHGIYQQWEQLVKTQELPDSDPYSNALEFLNTTVEGVNQCGEKSSLQKLTQRERDELVSRHIAPKRPLEYIRTFRKRNDDLNVSDATFPWFWRPSVQIPVQ